MWCEVGNDEVLELVVSSGGSLVKRVVGLLVYKLLYVMC